MDEPTSANQNSEDMENKVNRELGYPHPPTSSSKTSRICRKGLVPGSDIPAQSEGPASNLFDAFNTYGRLRQGWCATVHTTVDANRLASIMLQVHQNSRPCSASGSLGVLVAAHGT